METKLYLKQKCRQSSPLGLLSKLYLALWLKYNSYQTENHSAKEATQGCEGKLLVLDLLYLDYKIATQLAKLAGLP